MHQPRVRTFFLMVAAALGLMAFMAVAAQAENLKDGGKAASFLVEKLKSLAKAGVTFEFNQEGTGILLVPTRVDILCTSGVVKGEFKTTAPEGKEALGSAKFSGCTTWSPVGLNEVHKTKLPCTVNTKKEGAGGEKETITIEKALALPKLHENVAGEKEEYVLLEEDGAVFTTIFFEGPECALTRENKITGSVVGRLNGQIVGKTGSDLVEPLIEFSEEIQKLFQVENASKVIEGDQIKFGLFQAYIDASAKGKLTDAAHVGKALGVC